MQKKSSKLASVKFKDGKYLRNIKIQGEAIGAEVEVASSYIDDLAKIIEEGDFMPKHNFYADT